MVKCVVKVCQSRSGKINKASGVTFHKVPKDEERRDKWVQAIRLLRKETDWIPTKHSVICSKHFRDEDKIDPKGECGHVFLSNKAIPMLFDNRYPEEQVELLVEENMDVETDEEIDEITESPRMHKMRKMIHHLKNVSARRLSKIKNLSQKNKRLVIQNKKLRDVIEKLKNKQTYVVH